MGDSIHHCDLVKKLGINSSDQWVFYDSRFEKFFNFCAHTLSVDDNLLTEHEVLTRDELLRRGEFLDVSERQKRIQRIEHEYPGLTECTDAEVLCIEQDIAALQRKEEDYARLVEDMGCTKNKINVRLGRLEVDLYAELSAEKQLLAQCQNKCRNLEELQRENLKRSNEAAKCFTVTQSPPLFMHQLPMDQYFLKCDSFMQYFTLYMRENFKTQQYIGEEHGTDTQEIVGSLNSLANSINNYTLKYIEENANAKATESLIDLMDFRQFTGLSLSEMEAQTRELELFNDHHLNSVYQTHLNNLMRLVQQCTHQRMELILYENTKQKVERAKKRYEAVKCLTKLISHALSNAELIWIIMQLDLEKIIKRFNSFETLGVATKTCFKRLRAMQKLKGTTSTNCGEFVQKLSELLNTQCSLSVPNDIKSCLYEYEKFCRLLAYAEQGLWNKKSYASAQEHLDELSRVEQILQQLVYDGPSKAPMFVPMRFLQPIYQAKTNQQRIDTAFVRLRKQFQENSERMKNDKLWRYRQLLWIWFLTEPMRMLKVIEAVKKTAAEVSAMYKKKALTGIRRK